MTRVEKLLQERQAYLDHYNTQLHAIYEEQAKCAHEWLEPKYDPEIVNEPIYELHKQGVDIWPCITGHREVKKDRWSRCCSKCQKVEYTYEQTPVQYQPKFG